MPKRSDRGPDEPNLELPSLKLGFRRRKQEGAEAPTTTETGAPEPATPAEAAAAEPATPAEPAAPTQPAASTQLVVPTEPLAPQPVGPEPVAPEPAAPAEAATPGDVEGAEVEDAATAHRERRDLLSRVPGPAASVGAGIVCGLIGIVLSMASLRGCEAVRGVGTCGGIGLFALLAILVVEIFIGAALLNACRVQDAFSTSFLGVGLAAVVIVLFLLSYLDAWWMLVAVPLVTAAAYLVSWWVSSRFVDVRDDDRHR